MVEETYKLGVKVFKKELSANEAAKQLAEQGMKRNSASIYIKIFQAMLSGKLHKRAMNKEHAEYFLKHIRDDFGMEHYIKALSAIKLHIEYKKSIGTSSNVEQLYNQLISELSIDDEIQKIEDNLIGVNETEKLSLIKSRIGQSKYKSRLILKYKKCVLCEINIPELLVASHIKPWSESNNNEKLDLNNGLLLCSLHDKLFDLGFISFDTFGKIIISNQIDEFLYEELKLYKNKNIDVNGNMKKYLVWHKENKLK